MILSAWLVLCRFASLVLAPTLFGIQIGIIALIGMTLPIGVATKPRS
jgi:hypothetical protein